MVKNNFEVFISNYPVAPAILYDEELIKGAINPTPSQKL